jgi:hypothetical protein
MNNNRAELSRLKKETILKKKVHRALFDARKALHEKDEVSARRIVRKVIEESASLAYQASLEGGYNWVVEILKPLDELFLPDD